MSDTQSIIEKIKNAAKSNGYQLTDNVEKIARAKNAFFGSTKWARCPCDPESDRACISKRCRQDIADHGVCHCNLYKKGA
ncbi:MAG: hypothetical protein E7017_01735 [Alphaproteobacteria bacterium]|nr:hypothetical protein [Alphaproteobacteria bacterium]